MKKTLLFLTLAVSPLCVVSCSSESTITTIEDVEKVVKDLEENDPEKAEEFKKAMFAIYVFHAAQGKDMKTKVPDEIKSLTVDEIIELSKTEKYAGAKKSTKAMTALAELGESLGDSGDANKAFKKVVEAEIRELKLFKKIREKLMKEPHYFNAMAHKAGGGIRTTSFKEAMSQRWYDVFSKVELGRMQSGMKAIFFEVDTYRWGKSEPTTKYISVRITEDTTVKFHQEGRQGVLQINTPSDSDSWRSQNEFIHLYEPRNSESLVDVIKFVRDASDEEYKVFEAASSEKVELEKGENFTKFIEGKF